MQPGPDHFLRKWIRQRKLDKQLRQQGQGGSPTSHGNSHKGPSPGRAGPARGHGIGHSGPRSACISGRPPGISAPPRFVHLLPYMILWWNASHPLAPPSQNLASHGQKLVAICHTVVPGSCEDSPCFQPMPGSLSHVQLRNGSDILLRVDVQATHPPFPPSQCRTLVKRKHSLGQ